MRRPTVTIDENDILSKRQHQSLDHLGSPRYITDGAGNFISEHKYYPFGEEATRPAQDELPLKFTGHERDFYADGEGDDLDYMHARFCDPRLGRFLSVDPVLGKVGLPQSWNRFSYVLNNPLKFVDPFGLEEVDQCSSEGGEGGEAGEGGDGGEGGKVSCSGTVDVVGEDPEPSSATITPFEVGWEWLTGKQPRERHFSEGDVFTGLLKKHQHVQDTTQLVCSGSKRRSDNNSYSLSGVQGVPKYLGDYSTLATFGATGNLGVTYLGSYNLKYSLEGGYVNFSVSNVSSFASATRPPVLGYSDPWQKHVAPRVNSMFSAGPLSDSKQLFNFAVQCP